MRLSEERYDNPAYRDIKNSIDTAKEEGREEGVAKEKLATAKRLLGMGLTQEQVAKGTGLSIKEIEKLILSLKENKAPDSIVTIGGFYIYSLVLSLKISREIEIQDLLLCSLIWFHRPVWILVQWRVCIGLMVRSSKHKLTQRHWL